MSIEWQDTSKPDQNRLPGFMLDDMRTPNQERRDYVRAFAASLTGLTLEQMESKLERLDEGYRAYQFTVNGDSRGSVSRSPAFEDGRASRSPSASEASSKKRVSTSPNSRTARQERIVAKTSRAAAFAGALF